MADLLKRDEKGTVCRPFPPPHNKLTLLLLQTKQEFGFRMYTTTDEAGSFNLYGMKNFYTSQAVNDLTPSQTSKEFGVDMLAGPAKPFDFSGLGKSVILA